MVWDVEVGRSPLPASKTCTCFKNLPPGINQISVMLYCDCAAKYGYHLDFTHFHQLFWRRKWQLTPVFLPGESHGQRSLVGYSPWGHKGSDTTERLTLTHHHGWASQVGLVVKNLPSRRHKSFDPCVRKILWRRARQSTSVFLLGEWHRQRSLVAYSPRDCKELDRTEAT